MKTTTPTKPTPTKTTTTTATTTTFLVCETTGINLVGYKNQGKTIVSKNDF